MDREFWIKHLKSLGISLAGAALAYVSTSFIPALQELKTPSAILLASLAGFAVNAVKLALPLLVSHKEAGK